MKKYLIYIILTWVALNVHAQTKHPPFSIGSPQKSINLTLDVDSFNLNKIYWHSDIGEFQTLISGKYHYTNDTLFLLAKNKTFKLKKETDEIYSVISPIYTQTDTLYIGDKLFANAIYYPNGQTKQTGGWNKDGKREGVWIYYDSSGNEIRKRLFKDGVLIDDNHKWPWEK